MDSSMSIDLKRDLSETEKWFRDNLLAMLRWGGAIIVVIVGWTLKGDEFSLAGFPLRCPDKCQRGLGLLLIYPLFLLAWCISVVWARERCPEHSTVPPRIAVYGYTAATTILSLIILGFVLD